MGKARTGERRAAVRSLARVARLREHSSDGLSLAHYRVLAAIAEGHEQASRVAARLVLGKPTVSASVDAMCRRGLIERADDADDQRSTTLRLTPAGVVSLSESETETTLCDRSTPCCPTPTRPTKRRMCSAGSATRSTG